MMVFDPVLVHEWLGRSAHRHPTKEAIVCGKDRWTYTKLNSCADRLAEALIDLGVSRQDRVVIVTGNCAETVVSMYGTLKGGGVFVVLEGTTRARRLRYVVENCGPKVLIASTAQGSTVADALAGLSGQPQVIWVGTGGRSSQQPAVRGVAWESVLGTGAEAESPGDLEVTDRCPRTIDIDLASLIYTSATTGRAKGVMCTHHNMVSAARSIIQYIGNDEDDIILDALPLSFDYGLYQVLMAIMFGGTVVLEQSFIFLHDLLKRIATERVTGFPIVPTMLAMLLRMDDLSQYDLSCLRYITNTGAALPVEHIRRLQKLLPHVTIFSMFGLTECKRVGYLEPGELDRRPNSVGKAMPNCEVSIVDEESHEVGPGVVGELVIRGSNVMQGYWADGEATARAYHAGPYPASRQLHSGDYFKRDDDGFLYFLGRKDDMIKTRGERVAPKEVENVICELSDICEAAVVPVPDDVLGMAIKAFVVTRGGNRDEKRVLRHCHNNLERFMVPKYIEFVSALPRTAHGKIDKRALQVVEGAGNRGTPAGG